MSHDTPIFRGQDQSESAGPSDGEHARGSSDPRAVQLETIKVLDDVLSDFVAQWTPMCNAFRLLTTTLKENPSLMLEQWAEAYDRYGGCLEESYGAHMQAIAQGSWEPNHASLEPDPLGEDGVGEPNIDDEAQAPAQDPCCSIPSHAPRLPPKHGEQGGILKQTTDNEGNNQRDYTWNWDTPGGGPPWVTSTKEVYPLRGKHISCRMSTSPTSSVPSRTLSCNKITLTSCLSSGETSSLTDKLTLECLLKTNSPELPLTIMSSTLVTTSNSRQRDQANPKPKL